ncbi:MAG TPA: hypothetical protein VFY93_14720 [Planctomycetota bacterium]|nr:hypothetical protein [Planctomycetota bacterium]
MRILALLVLAAVGCGKDNAPAAASLETIDGVTVVHVAGTPKEMGEQAGRLLKDRIRALLTDYLGAALPGDRSPVLLAARQMEAHIPARYRDEMKALAAAADVPYDDLLLGNVMVDPVPGTGSGVRKCAAGKRLWR